MDKIFTEVCSLSGVERALSESGIKTPTEIQKKAIPVIAGGADAIVKAPTGTGKTLAYLLPALNKTDVYDSCVQTLILCPTRELSIQIYDVLKDLLKYSENVRCAVLYGGENFQKQLYSLRKRPQIVIGTVGRIADHLERKTLKIKDVRTLVLDEGDVMLDMGFLPEIKKIMAKMNTDRQNLVFSATVPEAISALCREIMKDPVSIEVEGSGKNSPAVAQFCALVKDSQRVPCLAALARSGGYGRFLVFCNTKFRAEKVFAALESRGFKGVLLHGDLDQRDRSAAMKKFRQGEAECLVSTDVAARGIDVDDVDAVFNLDPPSDEDFYVHRIGRTARAAKKGVSYTFVDAGQLFLVKAYERKTGASIGFIKPVFDASAAFTLPRDSSNRRGAAGREEDRKTGKRFFLNVGKRDLLDKETLARFISVRAGIEEYELLDVKVRDTYSFVQVPDACAGKVRALAGSLFGNRALSVEIADEKKEKTPSAKRSVKDKGGVKSGAARKTAGGFGGKRKSGTVRAGSGRKPRGKR